MRAAALFGVLATAKILSLAGRELPASAWAPAAYLWQDALAALLFAGVDLALRRPRWLWAVYGAAALYAAVNVPVARVLSTPLTWPMMRAARGTLADSILHYATPLHLALVAAVLAAAAALPFLLRRVPVRALRAAGLAGMALVVGGPWASARVDTGGLNRNALAALVTTALPRVAAEAGREDWRAASPDSPAEDLSAWRGRARGRNVILVGLESTGARYLRPWGAAEDPMPNLTALASSALLFENAYAVTPESVKGLMSVLCSVTPAIETPPEAYASTRIPSLAASLSLAGYRTGLFHSGRFGYLGMESVVGGRGFEALEDAGAIGGERESSFGVDEPGAVRRILAWIDGLPRGGRFFVSYLPVAGHHPYSTPAAGPFREDGEIGAYRNALHHADEALGQLLRGLRERGLEEETLVAVYGDHGEAFGQHAGNTGHTLCLFEENVRVPLLFALPGDARGPARARRTASLLDLAPTVADLLALPAPEGWQGVTLLDGAPRAALFFTDYAVGLLGHRDGRWKLIHEVDSGRSKLFDLEADPGETRDLSGAHRALVADRSARLLRWCAAVKHAVRGGGP